MIRENSGRFRRGAAANLPTEAGIPPQEKLMEQARNNGLGLRPGMAKTITGPSAMRVVRGPAGGMLVVYETGPENARTLIFEWAGSKTELTSFPADWRKLKDDELSKLHRTAAGG